MKTLLAIGVAIGLSVTSAQATETFSQDNLAPALPTVDSQALNDLTACINADMNDVSSRAIRACTKAYRASVPDYDIRADILTRRGLMRLSTGKVKAATRDFDKAARLVDDNEFANLGLGFAALIEEDAQTAKDRFADCADHKRAAPLAAYGLALTLEMSGDRAGAIEAYERALELQPGWSMAEENLANLKAAT